MSTLLWLSPPDSFLPYPRAARLEHCQQPVSCLMNLSGRHHSSIGICRLGSSSGPTSISFKMPRRCWGLSYPHSELSQDSDDIFDLNLSLETAAISFQRWNWELGGPRLQ